MLAIRLYLGGLFVWASLHKIAEPATFALDVATYQLLPLWAINPFALTVPWLELWVGILLMLGIRVRAAALVTSLLMAAFMVALGFALAKGLDLSCGCFASQATAKHDPISYKTMVRDAIWFGLSLIILFFDQHPIGVVPQRLERRAT